MSRDLDARARRAAANLKAAVEVAALTSTSPATPIRRRPLVAVLRPVLIVALLAIGSAVGVAVVTDSSPPPIVVPPATTTTTTTTTTVAPTAAAEPATTTSLHVVPVAPASTTTTVAPDLEPPPLEITSPEDGAHLEEKTVTFEGATEPGARVFTGKYEADVDSSGQWRIVLILNEGSNVARFVARDSAGNESEASVTVHYVVETPTTTTTIEKELAEFTAEATFGSCSETPPYDVYYGTGEPDSIVEITSEYGSGSVEVGAEGNWEKKVVFETAPTGEPFVVLVADGYGRSAEFEFIYTP